jgi:hypothetical protein
MVVRIPWQWQVYSAQQALGLTHVIQARIHHGRIEIQEPIPVEWEGQLVKILPLTPDDPVLDLEQRLAALQALGPMDFEPGERESIARELSEMDRISREAMQQLAGS